MLFTLCNFKSELLRFLPIKFVQVTAKLSLKINELMLSNGVDVFGEK